MKFIALLAEGLNATDFIRDMSHRGVQVERFEHCSTLVIILGVACVQQALLLPGVVRASIMSEHPPAHEHKEPILQQLLHFFEK